jgi:hypothetical protein
MGECSRLAGVVSAVWFLACGSRSTAPAVDGGSPVDGGPTTDSGIGQDGGTGIDAGLAWDLTFNADPGYRVASATNPAAYIDDAGVVYVGYLVKGTSGTFKVVTSTDGGLSFGAPNDPTAFEEIMLQRHGHEMPKPDDAGSTILRAYGWEPSGGGYFGSRTYTNNAVVVENGVRFDPPYSDSIGVSTFFPVDGGLGLLYINDAFGNNANVHSACSTDNGWSFSFVSDNPLGDQGRAADGGWNVRDPHAFPVTDERIRVFYMMQGEGPEIPGSRRCCAIYSFITTDGVTFTAEPGVRLDPASFTNPVVWGLHDPQLVRLKDGRYRMYVTGRIAEMDGGEGIVSATTPFPY